MSDNTSSGHGLFNNLVKYQSQSVVSKTIIKKPAGTVTVFAFDKGESLSEHTAPFDALIFLVDGKADITIAGNKNSVTAPEYIILPANKPHAIYAAEKFKMVLTLIKS